MKTTLANFIANIQGLNFSYVCEFTGETISEVVADQGEKITDGTFILCESAACYDIDFVVEHSGIEIVPEPVVKSKHEIVVDEMIAKYGQADFDLVTTVYANRNGIKTKEAQKAYTKMLDDGYTLVCGLWEKHNNIEVEKMFASNFEFAVESIDIDFLDLFDRRVTGTIHTHDTMLTFESKCDLTHYMFMTSVISARDSNFSFYDFNKKSLHESDVLEETGVYRPAIKL